MASETVVGVVGGSGLYEIEGIEGLEEVQVETPFGPPSDAFITGRLDGVRCVFVPRHGRGHRLTPTEVPYRANMWGLKKLGARFVVGVSAVGSLRERIEPGHLVVPDQLIDRTRERPRSFFGDGIVGHVQFGDPYAPELRELLLEAARDTGRTEVHNGGTYVCIEGPTFSTRAESDLFRSWGCDVVGMTNLPEARLAREAEMAYATLALSTDYDCWHTTHEEVSVESVVAIIRQNVAAAKSIIRATCRRLAELGDVEWPAHSALVGGAAIMTAPELIPAATRERVELLVGRHLWPEEHSK